MQGNKCRHIRPTKMNPESSRSHAIFTIYVSTTSTTSSLHLVDLAGSEGIRRTGHQGVARTEGVHINQGLLTIGKVLQALASKKQNKVIPYRESVLTSVLHESLNSNSYLTLLACISPYRKDLSETRSTLSFAQSAKLLKNDPQINSILMEIKEKKTKAKTPLRPTNGPTPNPTPYKRFLPNESNQTSTNKKTFYRNTFCTPSKIRKIEPKQFNHSDFGLTPNEKLKQDRLRLQNKCKYPELTNDTLESRTSLSSFNASTSTAIDAPSVKSYSPLLQRYVMELQTTFTENFEKLIDVLKTTKTETTNNFSNETQLQTCRKEMTNMLREFLLQFKNGAINEELPLLARDHNKENIELPEPSERTDNIRCRLFQEDTSIFKIPHPPKEKNKIECHFPGDTTEIENDFFDEENNTVLPKSARSSTPTCTEKTLSPIKHQDFRETTEKSVRRSKRLSTMNSSSSGPTTLRRSMRIESKRDISINATFKEPKAKPKRTKKTAPTNNKIIASYFEKTINNPKSNVGSKTAKEKHEKAVLDLLNTGSLKELQILPQVGLKTAYQIVTQRTLNGKFKNFQQVSKLPVWRGKAWERFKEANSIS